MRQWMAARRAEWFADKVCVDCGTADDLELDHVDPTQKVSHRIWSWSRERREAELAKCVARCHDCHLTKSRREGDLGRASRLVPFETVQEIRRLHAEGHSAAGLAREYGISRWAVRNFVANTARVNT